MTDEIEPISPEQARKILDEAHETAKHIINDYKDQVELMTQMLMEFETLDSEDVQEIVIKKSWDINKKKERLKRAADLHKKPPLPVAVPPPPPPKQEPGLNPI